MNKLTLSFFILIALIYASLAIAQSFFGLGSKPTGETPAAPTNQTAPAVHVLSPKDFKASVNTLNKKTQTGLSDQLKEQISKRPNTPAVQSTSPPNSASPPVSSATAATPGAMQTQPLPNLPTPPPGPTPSQTPPQVAPTESTTITVTPPANTQPQEPIYSGFQGQDNSQKTSNQPANQSGGGWNIKY